MSKKVATTVYITEQQQNLLKELNARSKVPIAEYIRQGIDLVIDRYKELLPGQMEFGVLPFGPQARPVEKSKSHSSNETEIQTHLKDAT